jgi:4-hydroxy-tetrahydrodipicolinate synthase
MPKPVAGIIPPLVTPLLDSGALDETGFALLMERVVGGGVHGVFVLGTTGESPSLAPAVRLQVVRRACELAAGRAPVLVNVTSTSAHEVRELAECAASAGADAVVLAPPFYFPLTQDELCGYFERTIPKLPLPVYLYNFPQLVKVQLGLETLKRLRGLPGLLGLKDSSGDMLYWGDVRKLFPFGSGFGLYCGPEECLVEALRLGADGGISGGANLFPALYTSLYDAHRRGDEAEVAILHELVREVSESLYAVSGGYAGALRGIKCALAALGISNGRTAEPLGPLTEEVRLRIEASARGLESRMPFARGGNL